MTESFSKENSYTALEKAISQRVIDHKPIAEGNRELVSRIGGAAFGAFSASVGRADPPLFVESAVLRRGKSIVLIGPNGSGKSTFLDALTDRGAHLETGLGRGALVIGSPIHARDFHRSARLDQEELFDEIGSYRAGEVLQYAAEYFKRQFPVAWEKTELHETNLKNQEAEIRIERLMEQIVGLFDIQEFLERKVCELSGGERTKLALFMLLLSEPDTLLLDEPTNHLDLRSIGKLMAIFNDYLAAGVPIVSVSHVDWYLEEAGVDGVLEVEWNSRGRVLRGSTSPYRKFILDSSRERVPLVSGDIEWQKDYDGREGQSLIQIPGTFTIPDSPLKNISFPTLTGGEFLILTGDNGSGKTKLLETFAKNKKAGLPIKHKGVNTAYLPQFWPEHVAGGTVGDFFDWIKTETSPHSQGSSEHPTQSAKNLFVKRARDLSFGGGGRIGESWLNRPLARLSGGEQRLLWFLAVSTIRDVHALILDEPTNHMDRFLQEKVAIMLKKFPGAVLLSTHDRTLLLRLSKEAGQKSGQTRFARHVVLEKNTGQTTAAVSEEDLETHIERIFREARQAARRFKKS